MTLTKSRACFPICVGAAALVVPMAAVGQSVQAELAQARKIGMPTEVSDLRQKPIPSGKNAAEIYRKIQALNLGSAQRDVANAAQRGASPQAILAGENALPKMKPLFDLVTQLDSHPRCDFGGGWSEPMGLNFAMASELKAIVKDLRFKADREDARGDWRGALRWLACADRVASDCGSDPGLISLLVEVAAKRIVYDEYVLLVQKHSKDGPFLEATDAKIRADYGLPDLRRHLGGDIVSMQVLLQPGAATRLAKSFETKFGIHPKAWDADATSTDSSKASLQALDAWWLRNWLLAWRKFPKDSGDWQGFRQALKATQASIQTEKSTVDPDVQGSFQTSATTMDVVGGWQADQRLLFTSLELLIARTAAGKLPAELPRRLRSIAKDPFDGNPLRYRQTGTGFTLYSIGRDRVDNGGRRRNLQDPAEAQYDEVVEFK